MLPIVVARSSSGGVVIRCVFLILWVTSYLLISGCCSKSSPSWGCQADTYEALGLARRNTRCRQWTLGTTSCSQGLLVGVLNIYDVMLAHNIHTYIATTKWRVLKVTLQLATPGEESAIYDCLVDCVAATFPQSYFYSFLKLFTAILLCRWTIWVLLHSGSKCCIYMFARFRPFSAFNRMWNNRMHCIRNSLAVVTVAEMKCLWRYFRMYYIHNSLAVVAVAEVKCLLWYCRCCFFRRHRKK